MDWSLTSFNEANALPGWLETHLPFFDDVRVYHAGPGGEYSTDGTMEIMEKWNIPYMVGSIDDGFGAVRTRAIRSSPCDYVMILDADERFYPIHRVLTCSGESTPHSDVDAILRTYDFSDLETMPPNWENVARLGANLRVEWGDIYDQGSNLRQFLEIAKPDAVATIRRHWHDLTLRRPTQNWHTDPDWQIRLVRNDDSVCFDPGTKMHERLVGARKVSQATDKFGPYFDHFHFTFKKMEQEQRSHDIAVYNAINDGRRPPMWEEFNQ